jgi:hypothetical protein
MSSKWLELLKPIIVDLEQPIGKDGDFDHSKPK